LSLKKNIIANYASQIYIILISIITLPELVKCMGAEAYGLVGFFSMVQSWLIMLDLGMSPTMSREVSRFRGGAIDANSLLSVFKILRKIFTVLGCVFAVVFISCSGLIATKWLKIETLSNRTVLVSVIFIILIVAIRWVGGFYKATIIGFEHLVWLSTFNTIIGTLRFVGVFVVFYFSGVSVTIFFIYQLIVAICELIILIITVNAMMPDEVQGEKVGYNAAMIKDTIRFSMTIAFTGAIWIAITQTDKLILSNLMVLSEFGYYSLAVQLAGGVMLIGGPISSAILPRMVRLEAEGKHKDLINLYESSTQIIVVITGTLCVMMTFFSKEILYAWSGDLALTEKVCPYLILYAIGNFLVSVAGFPYYLQYAKGHLKFHLYGNIAFLLVLVPTLIYVVIQYGGIGAGYVWIGVNLSYLLLWIPFIHRFFEKGLNKRWYFNDILLVIIPGTILAFAVSLIQYRIEQRYLTGFFLIILGFIIFIITALSSQIGRQMMRQVKQRFFEKGKL
jgi:O-antigen/teichoic acid export membrane protein